MYFIDYSKPLMHYGVKGMKWGVRKDRKKTYKEIKRGDINGLIRLNDISSLDEEYMKARDKHLKVAEDLRKDYGKQRLKYVKKAADIAWDKYHKGKDEYWLGYTKEQHLNDYLYDDLDQGSDSSYDLYLKDNKQKAQKLYNSISEYRKQAKRVAEHSLGNYGNLYIKNADHRYLTKAKDIAEDLLTRDIDYFDF